MQVSCQYVYINTHGQLYRDFDDLDEVPFNIINTIVEEMNKEN